MRVDKHARRTVKRNRVSASGGPPPAAPPGAPAPAPVPAPVVDGNGTPPRAVPVGGDGMSATPFAPIAESVIDLTAYPVLTEPVDSSRWRGGGGGGGGGGGDGGSDLGKAVNAAIGD